MPRKIKVRHQWKVKPVTKVKPSRRVYARPASNRDIDRILRELSKDALGGFDKDF